MFLRKGTIKSLNSVSPFAFCVFDKLLGTVNQMLTQKKWSCVCRKEVVLYQVEVKPLLWTTKQIGRDESSLHTHAKSCSLTELIGESTESIFLGRGTAQKLEPFIWGVVGVDVWVVLLGLFLLTYWIYCKWYKRTTASAMSVFGVWDEVDFRDRRKPPDSSGERSSD